MVCTLDSELIDNLFQGCAAVSFSLGILVNHKPPQPVSVIGVTGGKLKGKHGKPDDFFSAHMANGRAICLYSSFDAVSKEALFDAIYCF